MTQINTSSNPRAFGQQGDSRVVEKLATVALQITANFDPQQIYAAVHVEIPAKKDVAFNGRILEPQGVVISVACNISIPLRYSALYALKIAGNA
jgi:hypothetical protein